MKNNKPQIGQILSRFETDYYKEAMSETDWYTRLTPKRLPRKLKKALKAKSRPIEYRVTSISKSIDSHTITLIPNQSWKN